MKPMFGFLIFFSGMGFHANILSLLKFISQNKTAFAFGIVVLMVIQIVVSLYGYIYIKDEKK